MVWTAYAERSDPDILKQLHDVDCYSGLVTVAPSSVQPTQPADAIQSSSCLNMTISPAPFAESFKSTIDFEFSSNQEVFLAEPIQLDLPMSSASLASVCESDNRLEFVGEKGAPILAVADGVVEIAAEENILLVHEGGWATAYIYNKPKNVSHGDRVKRGQVIAEMASDIHPQNPRLWLEVMHAWRKVQPKLFFPGLPSQLLRGADDPLCRDLAVGDQD
jgi:hypothetical protein